MVQQGGAAAWGSGNSGWGTPPSEGQPPPSGGPPVAPEPPGAWKGGTGPAPDLNSGEPISAPMVWLAVAGVLEVIGLVFGLAAHQKPALSVAGWLIGGFGAISVLAWFTLADSRRRTSAWYSAGAGPAAIRGVLALAAVVVVAVNAYGFADWASRR
jgi:hypothetical protein